MKLLSKCDCNSHKQSQLINTFKKKTNCLLLMLATSSLSANAIDVPGAVIGNDNKAQVVTRLIPELAQNSTWPSTTRVITHGSLEKRISIADENNIATIGWHNNTQAPGQEFARIKVNTLGEKSWDVNLKSSANSQMIKKGQWLFASYYVKASNKNETANIRGFIEANKPHWKMISDASTIVGDKWTRVTALGRAPQDQPAGSVFISLHLATKAQSIDISDVQLVTLGADTPEQVFPISALTYPGMEADAPWRAKAESMIKKNRQNDFTIKLKTPSQEVVTNKPIEITQARLGYDIGSVAGPLLVNGTELTSQYRQWFNEFFNYATAAIYWADWGWENEQVKAQYSRAAKYYQEQNIPARAHVLLYPGFKFSPQELIDLKDDKAAFIAKVEEHIVEMVGFLKKHGINEYDVINELRDETEWTDIVGLETVAKWYKLVHKLHPEAVLYINENSILTDGGHNTNQQEHYFNTIKTLLDMGAPIHGIGMQGHFSGALTPVEDLWAVLDRFAQFNLPIRITEYDVNHRDTQGQGAYDTDFYTAIYAHPATVGVTRWDFYEPIMWRPLGGLIDDKNRYKPNAKKLKKWLAEKTIKPLTLKSDQQGQVVFTHLYGDYNVTVDGQTYPCSFRKNHTTECEVIIN